MTPTPCIDLRTDGTFGKDGGSYSDYLDYQNCLEYKRLNQRDVAGGVFTTTIGVLLATKAYNRYKSATDKLVSIATRQQDMSFWLKDHYLNTTFPQRMKALCEALEYPIPVVSYLSSDDKWRSKLTDISNQARSWRERLLKQYSIQGAPDCAGREIGIAQAVAVSNAGYATFRNSQRRREKHIGRKVAYVQRAHSASYASPSPIFGLMNDASQVYGSIYQNASNNLGGGLSLIGSGISNIFGGSASN